MDNLINRIRGKRLSGESITTTASRGPATTEVRSLLVRLTDAERERIHELARASGMSANSYIRLSLGLPERIDGDALAGTYGHPDIIS